MLFWKGDHDNVTISCCVNHFTSQGIISCNRLHLVAMHLNMEILPCLASVCIKRPYLYLKRERTHPGSLGRFSHLIAISSAVYRPILTKSVTEVVAGLVQHLAKSEFWNSKRLPWKSGKGDTPRQPRTFRGHTQAASDIEDTPRQPRTLRTHPGSLGHWRYKPVQPLRVWASHTFLRMF